MKSEYLWFNLLVIVFPVCLSFWRPAFFLHQWGRAWRAIALVAVPYLLWDAWVTGTHWTFNPNYTLGVRWFGLPLEEILFFFTVPFACLYSWEMFFRPNENPREHHPLWGALSWILVAAVPLGVWCLALGKGYTGLMLLALGSARLFDAALQTGLFARPRFHLFLGLVLLFTLVFNGYLTGRPVVLYGESHQLGVRIVTIPLEDFGYGVSLIACVTILFEWFKARDRVRGSWLERFIERRFGGYRHLRNEVDPSLPATVGEPKTVAIIGGGLAGMSAAAILGERGFHVTILEKNAYLGGKAGAWTTQLDDDVTMKVEHGFHAFFRHYYNLNDLLDKVGVTRHFRSVGDYMILTQQGETFRFKDVATTPLLNLLSLAHHGIYRLRDVAFGKSGPKMEAMLRYDPDTTFARFDHISFAEFAEEAELPHNLRLIFNTFARAFFADADRISMAELIKSFHFYYLSHNKGLIYDYLDDDYDAALLEPFRRYFAQHNVTVQRNQPVETLERTADGFVVNGETYDYAILAADVVGARRILSTSPLLDAAPALAQQLSSLQPSQRYAVWRIWVDRDVEMEHPVFVITERHRVLDAVALTHRAEKDAAAWVEAHGGAVLELHCYAVPDDLSEAEIRQSFLDELGRYFPGIQGCTLRHEVLQVNQNFTAFHLGLYAQRPTTETGIPGLYLAGDWVKLPYPAMLMEAACLSGLLAANAICADQQVQPHPVYSVPLQGILANVPEAPWQKTS